ncbi:Glycosyltransferase family 1 protein [Mycena venus]|uniref:sterol 3beta-glucosyltransferase n=1 Tax=Mycena venus TaxID=2733690 RepID=A0A8H6YV56_9AGAR|nr:Glycosyltransferase family 1 protein [Mycena venus]
MTSPPDTPARAETFSSDSFSSDEDITLPPLNFDHFYSEAAAFEKVLAVNGCIEDRESHQDGVNGFADLIGKDLTAEEQALASHAAKLRVTGAAPFWTPSRSGTIVKEPESYEEEDSSLDLSDDSSSTTFNQKKSFVCSSTSLAPLAPEGEEEKLVLETDGGLIKDVAIGKWLKVFVTENEKADAWGVLRSGPVVIHRKGWRSKRRLWMELSHDMMCTYPSSSENDKIRPIRTVLLSAIDKILPLDLKHPKWIRVVFKKLGEDKYSGFAEFDTEEAAIDWRKELTAAVFLYRHRRREALDGSESDESAGIRFSCPLARIESAEFLNPDMPGLATLQIINDTKVKRAIQIGPIYQLPAWQKLPATLASYKRMRTVHPSSLDELPIFVDLGPISFSDATSEVEAADLKEQAVRECVGLGRRARFVELVSCLFGSPPILIPSLVTRASVHRTIASTGYFVVSTNYISFWSKYFTQTDLRYRLPISTVRKTRPFSLLRSCAFGLTLEIEGHDDLKFVFKTEALRAEAITRISALLKVAHGPQMLSPTTATGTRTGQQLSRSATGIFAPLERTLQAAVARGATMEMVAKLPKAINLPRELLVHRESKHFVCLTIGSRGDVQPYIALGLGLMKEGHTVTIVTHEEYKPWVESFGIKHKQAGGDPGALMKLSVENKMFSPEFFKESIQNFRPWLDQLLLDSWESCQGADVLLESPSAMSGVHIAEALNIPYFRTFTMPWTKTAEFPHAFLSPPVESPTFNAASYVLFSNVMWTATSGQINRWRRHTLKIDSTDMGHLAQSKIPFIYNFSQGVVPKPLDWGDATTISGYWFLDNPEGVNWTPPPDLVEWMAKARKDGKAIVYIGFGSITVPHPNRVTARIVKAVLRADVRAIISKGWSARMSNGHDKDPEVEIPTECYQLDKVPHDWLFPQIDAAVHHGGAGTTGASLRAGIPTLIKPWFGDQFFWASRVQKLGAGLRVPSLHAHDFSKALIEATTSRVMKERAAAVGEKIRAEDGVHTAIHTIYTYLEHASSYIETIRHSHSHH